MKLWNKLSKLIVGKKNNTEKQINKQSRKNNKKKQQNIETTEK